MSDKAMSEQKQARAEEIAQAAKDPDWGQVVANGGPPCFHVEDGRFCLRAKRWGGHDEMHRYVDLAAALEDFGREERERYTTVYPAEEYCDDYGAVLWWHLPVCEPPFVGGFAEITEGWHTHFSRMPIVWDGDGQALRIAARIRERK